MRLKIRKTDPSTAAMLEMMMTMMMTMTMMMMMMMKKLQCPERKSVGRRSEDVRDVRSRLAILWRSAWPVTICYPIGNQAVPLFLGLSIEMGNDGHGHVVTADTARFAVAREAVVHHVLADDLELLLGSDSSPNKLDHGLRRLAIPDTCDKSAHCPQISLSVKAYRHMQTQ